MLSTRLSSVALAVVVALAPSTGLTPTASGDAPGSGEVRLLKDIYPGPYGGTFNFGTPLGDSRIFPADDGVHGMEPWITDGTRAGTRMLMDVQPGIGDSNPSSFTNFKGRVYFKADVGRDESGRAFGIEPWVTDGTTEGTTILKDIVPGFANSNPTDFTPIGDKLWFSVWTTASLDSGIWVTDGTAAGTTALRTDESDDFSASGFVDMGNGRVVFQGDDEEHGSEPWVSDGTTAGTRLLRDITPGPASSPASIMVRVGNRAVFSARETSLDPHSDFELWSTDGTSDGTRLLKELYPGPTLGDPFEFTPLGSKLLFSANAPGLGNELWATDGTTEGTTLVKDINAGPGNGYPNSFTAFDGRLYFAVDTAEAEELWATGGTADTTVPVMRLRLRGADDPPVRPNVNHHRFDNPQLRGVAHSRLYFSDLTSERLWSTDGTPEGIRSVPLPSSTSFRGPIRALGDGLLLWGTDEVNGGEYWIYEPDGFNRVVVRPTITSSGTVGRRLTSTPGQYAKPSTYGYQWLRNGTPIAGATSSSYVLRTADVGRKVSLRVTARSASDEPVTADSSSTSVVKFASTTAVATKRSGRTVIFSVEVRSSAPGATRGTVTVKDGSRTITTRTLVDGKRRIVLSGQSKRRHVYRIVFPGNATVAGSSASRSITVR